MNYALKYVVSNWKIDFLPFYPFFSGSEGEGDVDKYKLDEPEPDDSENEERVERLRNERVKRMAEIREKKRAERAKPEAEISDGEVDSGMVQRLNHRIHLFFW